MKKLLKIRGSKKWAINSCISIAKGNIILQTDADCIHREDWVYEMCKPFQNHSVGFVCGPSYIGKNNFWNELLKLESISQKVLLMQIQKEIYFYLVLQKI